MKVELIEISRVIPYARNPRRNENAIGKVAASIKEFGFRQPIVVDEEMVIIAGHSAGTEGDPGSLAQKRTTTFWNRLLVTASTPTNEGESKIASRYQQSDMRKYYVPCPECGVFQVLFWAQVKFDKQAPEATYYECEHCQAKLQESDKIWMLARGEWRAEAAFNGIAGFHISELYSPWVKWSDMVSSFLKAKRLPETLKVWINTSLGETWKEATEGIDPNGLLKRKENWGRIAPEGAVVVTAGVDVQGDRLETEIIGWGVGQENAEEKAVTAGFKSRAQVIRERGGNPQDVFEQIKQERSQEKEAGISFSTSSPPKQTQLSLFNEGEPDEKQNGTANKDV